MGLGLGTEHREQSRWKQVEQEVGYGLRQESSEIEDEGQFLMIFNRAERRHGTDKYVQYTVMATSTSGPTGRNDA